VPSVTLSTFPKLRPERDPGAVASPLAASNPTTKVWPFRIGATVVNTRTIAVGGPFQGPALIQWGTFAWGSAAVTGAGFALFWSEDGSGSGTNLSPGTRPSGTPIFEPIAHQTPTVVDTDEIREHFDQTAAGFTNAQPVPHLFNYYVTRPGAFFLKATIRNGSAGTFDMKGIISLIENVTPDQLARFL
jgi:hypothetical protein